MKKLLFILISFLFAAVTYGQKVSYSTSGDTLLMRYKVNGVVKTVQVYPDMLIGIALPDSVIFPTDTTNQRTFSDLKYVDKTTLTGTVYVTDYIADNDTSTSWNGAIQAAIDALEPQYGHRSTGLPEVGRVILPNLGMKITSPIKIYSGITLEGSGSSSELVEGAGFSGTELITLSPKVNSIDDAKIRDLKFTSTTVRAIGCGAVLSLSENVVNTTIENLTLNTVQGIILNEYTQASIIRNIYSYGAVDTLLYLYGNANVVENIDKEGGTGTSVGAYIYLNDLSGVGGACVGNILKDILIEGNCSANKSGMIIRNAVDIILENYWYEANNSDGYMLRVEGSDKITIRGYFHSIEDDIKLKIDSTNYVQIEEISSDAVPNSFYDCIEKDSLSSVFINNLHTRGYYSPFLLNKMDSGFHFDKVISSIIYSQKPAGYSYVYKPTFIGNNWLTNPSFENSDDGWSYIGGTPADTITKLKSEVAPDSMLRLVFNSGGIKFIYQTVTVTSAMVGKEFTLSGYAKAVSGSGGWVTTIIDGCGITAATGFIRVDTGEGWGIITQTFTPQSAGSLLVGVYSVNLTDVYIDEMFLTSGGSTTSLSDIKELISDSISTLEGSSALPLAGGTMVGSINSEDIIPKTSLNYKLGAWDSFFDSLSVHFIKILSGSVISAGAGSVVRLDADQWEFRKGNGGGNGFVSVNGNLDVIDTLDARVILKDGLPIGLSSTGNPDSLGGEPASAYLLKSDSTIYATQYDISSISGGTTDTTFIYQRLAEKLAYTDTTNLYALKLANKLDDSDTTTLVAMQWELDGKLSSLPDSVVYTSEISGDSIIGTANTLDSLITDYWNGDLGNIDSANVKSLISDSLATFTGGATSLNDLDDVNATETDGYFLSFDENTAQWVSVVAPSGSVTAAQITQINMLWADAQFDTTGTVANIVDSTGATTYTLIQSDTFAVAGYDTIYGMARVAVDSGQYNVKYNLRGTWTWSGWTSTAGFYKELDSAMVRHYSRGTDTTSRQRFYTSSDIDTFSVTTAAGGGFTRESLSPVLVLSSNDADSIVKSGSNTFVSITNNGWTFTDDDTTEAPVVTDSSFYFASGGTRRIIMADATGNPFDIELNDFSIEAWVYLTTTTGYIASKMDGAGISNWRFGVVSGEYSQANYRFQDTLGTHIAQVSSPDVAGLTGVWTHIGISHTKSTGCVLYRDGVAVTTESGSEWTDVATALMNDPGYLRVGYANLGHINVIAFYWTALSAQDFEDLYNLGRD